MSNPGEAILDGAAAPLPQRVVARYSWMAIFARHTNCSFTVVRSTASERIRWQCRQPKKGAMNMSDKHQQTGSKRSRATVRAIAVTALPILLLAGVLSIVNEDRPDRVDDEVNPMQKQSSAPDRQGEFAVPQASMGDFDAGRQVPSHSSEADFWYQARTGSDRYFTPRGDAAFAVLGRTDTPTLADVEQALQSDTLEQLDLDDMSPGLWIAVRTSEGNLAAYSIKSHAGISPGTLRIHYLLWRQDESTGAAAG